MDYLKLAQRTISMLDSMIESGECHTTRTKEMVNNAQNGLDQLHQYNVSGQSEQLKAIRKLKDFAYEVCPLHREDDLEEIVSSL